ncbi:hypothetical protein ANO11243_024810 [Dothideomycetidae sp. 11243]|nr:hypothetical protein ANO11243_024810 [fungal sp. No.11243]
MWHKGLMSVEQESFRYRTPETSSDGLFSIGMKHLSVHGTGSCKASSNVRNHPTPNKSPGQHSRRADPIIHCGKGDDELKTVTLQAFHDAVELAKSTLIPEIEFRRSKDAKLYFGDAKGYLIDIRKVYENIVGSGKSKTGSYTLGSLHVYITGERSACNDNTLGYHTHGLPQGEMTICDTAYEELGSLAQQTCDKWTGTVTLENKNLASVILHELVHWKSIGRQA